jgi:mannose-6-phosphate isomerase
MIRTISGAQSYAWGKKGLNSSVGVLLSSADDKFEIDNDSPYAELWMGTHKKCPSMVRQGAGNILLSDWLKLPENNTVVGRVPSGYERDNLPFLFKVLSIQKGLSIQAHPDKELAKELHLSDPENYPDDNHKPEMAIALTAFDALCGFRPISQIKSFLATYSSLKSICGDLDPAVTDASTREIKKKALRSFFNNFLRCPDSEIVEHINQFKIDATGEHAGDAEEACFRLMDQFPGDRGAFAPLILNFIRLAPGEGFFMGPNEPHAYLSGDCIECMALSDNVIRAACTPKFRDIENMVRSLHFQCGSDDRRITTEQLDKNTTRYRPPYDLCSEFEVNRTEVDKADEPYRLPILDCASIILFLKGGGVLNRTTEGKTSDQLQYSEGMTVLIAANESILVDASVSTLLYRANTNLGEVVS